MRGRMPDTSDCIEIVVEIDSELLPIIPSFLESRWSDCALIERLLEDGNHDEISRLGHRLKGAGGSYGFDAITDIGIALERAAIRQDHEAVVQAAAMLQNYLKRVKVVYV